MLICSSGKETNARSVCFVCAANCKSDHIPLRAPQLSKDGALVIAVFPLSGCDSRTSLGGQGSMRTASNLCLIPVERVPHSYHVSQRILSVEQADLIAMVNNVLSAKEIITSG